MVRHDRRRDAHRGTRLLLPRHLHARRPGGGVEGLADVISRAVVWIPFTALLHWQAAARRRDHETLLRASELKDSFLSAISHELRTPLTVISSAAQTLSNKRGADLPDELREHLLGRLLSNTDKLRALLTDLLDVERLSHGLLLLSKSPTDLSHVAFEVVHGLDAGFERVRMSLEPAVVAADPARIERVVAILVVNALKHTSGSVWVATRSTTEGRGRVVVEDEGPGIPHDVKHSLFAPFVQGPQSRSAASPGTGIGLALAHRLVVAHGGRLSLQDRPTGGSTLVVELELAPTGWVSSAGGDTAELSS